MPAQERRKCRRNPFLLCESASWGMAISQIGLIKPVDTGTFPNPNFHELKASMAIFGDTPDPSTLNETEL